MFGEFSSVELRKTCDISSEIISSTAAAKVLYHIHHIFIQFCDTGMNIGS
jgi:hypothetical protein